MESSYKKWKLLREQQESTTDPFTTLQQKQGDIVYFGVHDLAKQHKQNGSLPMMTMEVIGRKQGEITDADPVDQVVKVSVDKAPFHYGYRKLEKDKDKMRRFMSEDGHLEVRISVSNLIDISHLVDGEEKVWLVIDGSTKYQNNLMREIRRKEVARANAAPAPEESEYPKTRHYDDYEGEELSVEDEDEVDYMHVAHFDPTSNNGKVWKHFNETKRYSYYPT